METSNVFVMLNFLTSLFAHLQDENKTLLTWVMLNFQDFICTLERWEIMIWEIKMGHDLRTSSQQHRYNNGHLSQKRSCYMLQWCSLKVWGVSDHFWLPMEIWCINLPCPPALLGHRHIAQHGYLCITKEFVRDSCCHVQLLTLDKITWHIIHLYFLNWWKREIKN